MKAHPLRHPAFFNVCVLLAGMLLVASTPSTSSTPSTWTGESSYYRPDATYGPKGTAVRFEMSFDENKWAIDGNRLDHLGSDCAMLPRDNWDNMDPMQSIFGVDPYVGRSRSRQKTIGDLTFITPHRATKHSLVYFGYCYDDEELPICFTVTSGDMYSGWNEDKTKDCLPDAEDVLSTLRVSAVATSATPAEQ